MMTLNSLTKRSNYELVRLGDTIPDSLKASVEMCLTDKMCLTSPEMFSLVNVIDDTVGEFSKN